MSNKEIKELRQAGKLDEALKMANQALEKEPNNIWNKRAAAWVYYDYLKKYQHPAYFESFKKNLTNIKDLQLPKDEKMIYEKSAWQIGKMIFAIQKIVPVDYGKINEIFEIIKSFHFQKPSEEYSFLLKGFHKGNQNWSDYLTFADWWNLENLRAADYREEEFNGKKTMSIAEKVYIAYSKKLLEGEPSDPFGQHRIIDSEKIQSFLPKLDSLIKNHPEYVYPSYYKARLLLALGNKENVLSAFLPFAKQKRNDFWVWELMAEIFSEVKDTKFACYCKALSLRTREDYLVKLRQAFAEILIDTAMYDEAKTEIEKLIAARRKQGWKVPNQIVQWTEQAWYKSASSNKDNNDLYSRHSLQAEEILFQDVPEELIVVEFVNKNKNVLNFVKDQRKHGFFNYLGTLKKPQIGELLMVRFHGEGQNGFYKILSAKKADSALKSNALKDFEGVLKVIPPKNFGFVEDTFIEPKIIDHHALVNGQTVKGRAILTFNRNKKKWGWKAIEVRI